MPASFDLTATTAKESETTEYRSLRRHAAALMGVLLVVFGLAFLVYRWIERDEARNELASFAQSLPADFGPHSADITEYPGGIVVVRTDRREGPAGFTEERFAGDEYLTYMPQEGNFIVAKSENELSDEIARVAMILGVLFVATAIILSGWWALCKDEIKDLFQVS